jgi:hypothetical protein
MPKFRVIQAALAIALCSVSGQSSAQFPGFAQMPGEKMDGPVALDRALKASTLTFQGKPFHALMEIGATGTPYSGGIEVWWVTATKYHIAITSPSFSQMKTVNGNEVQEKNTGDYYPRWLQDFVQALIDPLPMENNFRGGGAVMVGLQVTESCLRRDDRPGGITDQLTWGQVCFSGSEPRLSSVLTFNDSMEFKDWKGFGKKQIARTYQTDVLDYQPVIGRLTKLEELKQPDEAMFAVTDPTPVDQRISTDLVSTLKEESLVEKAPDIQWPSVREGKTDGYMIVYARTDRTGQVRETAKHNSDQPGLESFGMEQALHYKFKPLIVDGVAQQMEMPLVLHFSSRLEDPLPILSVTDMKKQMISCDIGKLPPGTPKGTVIHIRVSVNETGKVTGAGAVGPGTGNLWLSSMARIESCRFAPYVMNGKATYYKGDVELTGP